MGAKLNEASIMFSRRIKDVVSLATDGGEILSAEERVGYLNRAIKTFYNKAYLEAGSSPQLMIEAFPELQKFTSAVTLDAGTFNFVSPYLDFHKVIGSVSISGKYVRVWDSYLYSLAVSGKHSHYTASLTEPALIQMDNKLLYFPRTTFQEQVVVHYLAKPVDPETGGDYTLDGSFDISFDYHWLPEIVEIAYQIYSQDRNITG